MRPVCREPPTLNAGRYRSRRRSRTPLVRTLAVRTARRLHWASVSSPPHRARRAGRSATLEHRQHRSHFFGRGGDLAPGRAAGVHPRRSPSSACGLGMTGRRAWLGVWPGTARHRGRAAATGCALLLHRIRPAHALGGHGGALTFQNHGASAFLTQTVSGKGNTLTADITLADGLAVGNYSTNPLTISGDLTGPGGLSFTGPGAVILAGVSTYAGATTISGGTVRLRGGAVPAPVAGFARWFDASGTSHLATNGLGLVTQWNDLSPAQAHATPQTGHSPTFVANALNGLGALHLGPGPAYNPATSDSLNFASDTTIRSVFSIFKGSSFSPDQHECLRLPPAERHYRSGAAVGGRAELLDERQHPERRHLRERESCGRYQLPDAHECEQRLQPRGSHHHGLRPSGRLQPGPHVSCRGPMAGQGAHLRPGAQRYQSAVGGTVSKPEVVRLRRLQYVTGRHRPGAQRGRHTRPRRHVSVGPLAQRRRRVYHQQHLAAPGEPHRLRERDFDNFRRIANELRRRGVIAGEGRQRQPGTYRHEHRHGADPGEPGDVAGRRVRGAREGRRLAPAARWRGAVPSRGR